MSETTRPLSGPSSRAPDTEEEFDVVWSGQAGHYLLEREPPMPPTVLQEFEEVALQGCRAVKEFLTYRGNNKEYLNRAKVGAVAMGSYSRLRATVANEAQIKLIQQRMVGDDKPKQLPAVSTAVSK